MGYRLTLEEKAKRLHGTHFAQGAKWAREDILKYIRGCKTRSQRGFPGFTSIPHEKGFATVRRYKDFEDLLRQVQAQKPLALTSGSEYIRELAKIVDENGDRTYDWHNWVRDKAE